MIICANQRETPQIQHMVKNHASCVIPHYKMEYQRVPRIHHFMVCFILMDRTFSGALCERNSPNTQWKSVMEMEHRALLTCLPIEHVVFHVPCLTTDQTVTSLKWCLCIEVTRSKFEHFMMPMARWLELHSGDASWQQINHFSIHIFPYPSRIEQRHFPLTPWFPLCLRLGCVPILGCRVPMSCVSYVIKPWYLQIEVSMSLYPHHLLGILQQFHRSCII